MPVIVFGNGAFDEILRRFGGRPWDPDRAVANYLFEKHGIPYTVKDAVFFRKVNPTNWFKIAIAQIYCESVG